VPRQGGGAFHFKEDGQAKEKNLGWTSTLGGGDLKVVATTLEDIIWRSISRQGEGVVFSSQGATWLGARSPLLHHLSRGFVFYFSCIFK
jgi:hypothetical protein